MILELYNTLIGQGLYDEALVVFSDRLNWAILYRLSASRQRTELLEALFPDGTDALPRLKEASDQAWTLNALTLSYLQAQHDFDCWLIAVQPKSLEFAGPLSAEVEGALEDLVAEIEGHLGPIETPAPGA